MLDSIARAEEADYGGSPYRKIYPHAIMDETRGRSELGVVVPTGFEPVFKP